MAISPLIFSVIYDEVGNVRGQEMLVAQQRIQCIDPVLFRSHSEVDKKAKNATENTIAPLAECDGVDTFEDSV